MYTNSFSLENRKENAVLASVHIIRFENVIKNVIPIFGNKLWTVALIWISTSFLVKSWLSWLPDQ